ncbi:germination protein YpeB [Acetivibrio straminisolvens]|uniref:Spore germination protein YpeB n=1 Tax=Acetivibrio straminisolvens JCM 21531 TaxID=1294263 RepID=W4V6U9_9FIRM|nr:germination protein YpeB [Acetivibrio straminisolvens]GAE88543.1 spore germination protein YpeB [Acetivibrio straminisolvens JCM 21531]
MSIREKLLDFKRRLADRKMYSIVIVAIAAVAMWGFYQYKHAADLRQELDNQYNRAFYEMVGYVNNVEVLLLKSLISNSPEKTAQTMQEAWRQSNLAQSNLGQLPITPNVLANTSKFLTQVGDLAYSINNQNMAGKGLTEEQYKLIEQLHGFSVSLEQSLNDLQNQLSAGRIKWGELANKGTPLFQKTSQNMPMEQFENIDKTFQDYPTLIYDGPFSDHMTMSEPKGLTGNEMNPEEAKQRVIDFFGKDKVSAVEDTGRNDATAIKTYSYRVKFNNVPEDQTATVDVTQKGGHVLWMLYNRPIGAEETINIDQAKELGKKFLEERGYKNMVDTYYLKEDNTAVINYAYKQGDVVVYPDLIKVKIALDDGEVIGFESKGYLSNHVERNIPAPKLTAEEARTKISSRMQVLSSGLAIIPTDYKTEIYTYEFKGKLNDKDFLVYINAETGKEENILMIIDTPNGVLTM